MKRHQIKLNGRAQMGIEYLLIVTVVAIIAIASFGPNGILKGAYDSQHGEDPNGFFTKVTRVIQGDKPEKINGDWCGGMVPTCECPAPAFGGNDCPGQ